MEISHGVYVKRIASGILGNFTFGVAPQRPAAHVLLLARMFPSKLALGALALALLNPSLTAGQSQTGNTPGTSAPGWPISNTLPGHGRVIPDPTNGMQSPETGPADESCSLWTVAAAQGPTISAAGLQVPGKARGEYRKGCSDLRGGKLEHAEGHLRKAVQEYPQYAAAWVLLGEVLETGRRIEDARGACSHASSVDSNYVPAYLCLADVSAQQEDWNQTLNLADRALALYPMHDVYGCFYAGMAQFHLNDLAAAEKEALEAMNADRNQRVPQVHLLLAQIYMAKHDSFSAAAQLRAYLKVAPNSPVSAGVRKSLAELDDEVPK
jgi:tetratricopeptide (TPR) repeat protein